MMGKSHGLTDEKITLPLAAVTAVSALLPDIDEPNFLLVSRAIPTRFLRFLQIAPVGLGVFLYFYGVCPLGYVACRACRYCISYADPLPAECGNGADRRRVNYFWPYLHSLEFHHWQFANHLRTAATSRSDPYFFWGSLLECIALLFNLLLRKYALDRRRLIVSASSACGLTHQSWDPADSASPMGLKLNLMSTGTWKGSIVEGGFILLTFTLVYFVFFRHATV